MADKKIFMKDMTWQEIEIRLSESDIAILPVGQTEQHGHHLPTDIDNIIATGLAERVALATFNSAKPVIAPTITFGYSDVPVFRDYPGVFSLQPETLINLYKDVAKSLVKMGFKKIIFINGHALNPPFIAEAMRQLTKDTGAFFASCNFFDMAREEVTMLMKEMNRANSWGHACLIETSVSQVFGAEIREDKVIGSVPRPIAKGFENYAPCPAGITFPSFEYMETAKSYWPTDGPKGGSGTKGDPVGYSKEIGERIINYTVLKIVQLVNDIKDIKVNLVVNGGRDSGC